MIDMLRTIEPKTDQLNADSLQGGPITVTVTGVSGNDSAEQPVSIHYEGEAGRPFKPCKSMRRVLVHIWGADAKQYIGRSMTLYCDPGVMFGGMKVGGIRISHMSHIDKAQTMALTATRSKRAPFTVQPMTGVDALVAQFNTATTQTAMDAAEATRGEMWKSISRPEQATLKAVSDAAKARITKPADATTAAPTSSEPQA